MRLPASKSIATAALVALLAGSGAVWGQEKETPRKPQAPTTRIGIPEDSLKVDDSQRQTAKPAEKPDQRLKLPDVMIYGEDRAKRKAGKKITITPDQPELITPPSLYEPVQAEAIERGQRTTLDSTRKQRQRQLETSAFGGRYSQFGASAVWWQNLTDIDYQLDADFSRTNGQFPNSARDDLAVGLGLGWHPAENSQWRLQGNYLSADYGLYGAADPEDDRRLTQGRAEFTGEAGLADALSLELSAEIGSADLQDKAFAAGQTRETRETASTLDHRAAATLKWALKNSEFNLEYETVGDQFEATHVGKVDLSESLWQARYAFLLGKSLGAQVSAGFSSRLVRGIRENKFRPGARLVYVPSQNVTLFGEFRSGYEYQRWTDRLQNNPYLQAGAYAVPADVLWDVDVEMEWRITPGLVLQAAFKRTRTDDYAYFERDSLGTFAIQTADVRLGEVSLGLELSLSEVLQAEFSLQSLEDAVRQDGDLVPELDLPYRPEMRIPAKLTYRPGKAWQIDLNLAFVGTRRTMLLSTEELPSYVNLGAGAAYRFNKTVELFLELDNLLDSNYEIWQGYREMGFNTILGARARW